ncbi:MAG TPA: hypothetical protein DC046_17825 [Rhodospirillaceae bacterium]|nr:hypothetical protein [Rhodospirillaceae bacterium]|tara:strand:- start:1151 stop:1357 length:207 start_codon:yes stop_codon:yes gene_type:complete
MADDNIVLEHLRAIRSTLDTLVTGQRELTGRVGMMETQYANLSNRIDRIADDVSLIKRRLDLSDVPAE